MDFLRGCRLFNAFGAEVDSILVEGDRAVAIGTYHATPKAGAAFTVRFAHVFTLRDG